MEDFKGTPGPWGVTHVVEGHKPGIDAYQNGKPTKTVILWATAEEWAGIINEGSEQLANANLIAAAPELLDALQNLIKWKVGTVNHYRAYNDAQSAINKALGL
ncbi:hypothetical protein [Mucilaginibacter xinganensis]|uniref:Uncharacterized protein n=1 Tax=Mucilaginibacter xinganensis TaxID=1234841 RepID=A0A223NX45_9SPHI|nr:hypothetical protein [Mucilaginibacter xinganensis]ASU34360.1 hypothetical protein MuYL_2473 [Mucilaginibacter xinganensis]